VILLIYAHPHPGRSIANRALLDAVRDLPGVVLHSLYDRYPDFSIDVAAEQVLVADSGVIVWQHPTYWYSVPALLKLWIDKVLARGWAYGEGGTVLHGKSLLWVTTTGSEESQYAVGQRHGRPFGELSSHIEQTARFCGMNWLEPMVAHGAHRLSPDALAACAAAYRQRLSALDRQS
jgi:glutathione-regulated potassium-efflux system ancillary protein KefF